ncbi:hypothetical protein Taro_032352, partial [Colocasia esculenta]|nr:hypothetical protein [Colocasia esculenta]
MRIGLRKHQESRSREENSSCRQMDFWEALKRFSYCVDLPIGCVDTLSQTGQNSSLGEASSVDTTSSRVDTQGLEHCVDTSMGCVDTTFEEI